MEARSGIAVIFPSARSLSGQNVIYIIIIFILLIIYLYYYYYIYIITLLGLACSSHGANCDFVPFQSLKSFIR